MAPSDDTFSSTIEGVTFSDQSSSNTVPKYSCFLYFSCTYIALKKHVIDCFCIKIEDEDYESLFKNLQHLDDYEIPYYGFMYRIVNIEKQKCILRLMTKWLKNCNIKYRYRG